MKLALRHPSLSARHASRLGALALLALAVALAGCGALPDKPARATLYDFGPGTIATPAPSARAADLPTIALAEIEANARLDGTQLLYRLGYADANELRPYGQSRWSLPPAQLLRQRLREGLSARRMVLEPEESATLARAEGKVPDTLRLALEEFGQYFESPSSSVGVVRLHATLIRRTPGGDQVLAQRSFVSRKPAPTSDAAGGVKALASASDALVAELVNWVDQPR
ncbi:conserved hypothetical protein [Burkholderiales bacterium 8X]|nr:conserved hypothetical protein [Burkholderiales bacterium 8X]